MDPNRIKTIEDENEQRDMGRTYPLLEAKSTAQAVLTNCSKISRLASSVDKPGAEQLQGEVNKAAMSFDSVKDSASALDRWYRDELTPLLTKAERLGHEALKSATGAGEYDPKGKKPRSGLSLDES